jgi:hypothetical protein
MHVCGEWITAAAANGEGTGGLIRPDIRAFFARAANGFFQPRHLISEKKPAFSGRNEPPAIPGGAFCLR